MPERAIAINADESESGLRELLRRALGRNPFDAIAIFVLLLASGAILANALYRQPGPHPAPIFSIKPRPVVTEPAGGVVPAIPRAKPEALVAPKPEASAPAARTRANITADIQRELSRRGLYDGPADGVLGPKTDAAMRDFEVSARLKPTGEPTEELLAAIQRSPIKREAAVPAKPLSRPDPIADLIAPSARVTAVQRALNDYGYGPVKATGQYGTETITAIQKFERDRKLPVTGQISPRLMRELSALTGRPLE